MDIGDIYTVEIPPSDGHEQAGTRPFPDGATTSINNDP
jgi:mRNA-degrading endonuclease toxin of MazEF toxin-antitoxin module